MDKTEDLEQLTDDERVAQRAFIIRELTPAEMQNFIEEYWWCDSTLNPFK